MHQGANYGADAVMCYAWHGAAWCKVGYTAADQRNNVGVHECDRPSSSYTCDITPPDLMQDLRARGRRGANWEEIFLIEASAGLGFRKEPFIWAPSTSLLHGEDFGTRDALSG